MCFLVIEQLPGTNKACGCDHNNGNPEKDEGEPVVTAKRPRQPFQLQSASRIRRVRICRPRSGAAERACAEARLQRRLRRGRLGIDRRAHPLRRREAAWSRPKVDHPFNLADGGIGAWEIAARYSTVDLNSNVIPGVSQSLIGGVYGGQQQIAALALSWYPNDWLRFMPQFQYVDVSKLNLAGMVQNRPALRDDRGPGPGRLVKLTPRVEYSRRE
jgi:hypothetical protein